MDSQKIKKIIVTGVSGQTGACMLKYLIHNTDAEVVGTIRRTSQIIDSNFKDYVQHTRFKLVHLDLDDIHSITSLVKNEQPDIIFNFGGRAFVPDSWNSPAATIQTNTIAVIHFLEAIRNHAPHCRFMNACSSEIFGHVLETPQKETTPPNPRSVYGVSKNAAREIIEVYRKSYGLYACSAISFNHEGILRQKHYVTRKITSNVARIVDEYPNGEVTPLELGNLDAKRDWSDAEDFVSGMWLMMQQAKPTDYVLSSNETHKIREFVEQAFACAGFGVEECRWEGSGKEEVYKHGDTVLVKINPDYHRPAEVELLLGDSTKIREELGWKPETDFLGLVRKMVENDLK